MAKRIVYKDGDGISILSPTGELPLEEVARKDVPKGLPYIILNTNDFPNDREFRNAWEADFSNPDGYGIGHDDWFAEQEAKKDIT